MRPLRTLVALCAALALPALARAQAAAGVATTPPSTWHLGLDADGSWYENPYFGTTDQSSSAWSTSGYATLGRTQRFETGSFSLSGFGGVLYYPDIEDFNQPTYGGSFNLNLASSRRTQFGLGATYRRSNTRSQQGFESQTPPPSGSPPSGSLPPAGPPEGLTPELPQDVPLPTSDYETADATVSFQQQLSQSWQFGLAGSVMWRLYADERLSGGEQVNGSAQLGHTLGKTSSMYLAYGYGASWFEEGGVTRSHQGLLGVQKRVGKGVSLALAGGVGYLESTGSFYPAGNASLSASGRRSTFTLAYSRDFGQAFGYGRQTIGDLVTASLAWTATRKLGFNASYYFDYRRDALDETYTIRTHNVSVGFNWQIVKSLGFGGRYGWERNETEGQPIVDGQRAMATLSYGVDWR